MPQLRYPRVDIVDVRQGSPDGPTHTRVTQPCDTCRTWDWCRLRQACWHLVAPEIAAAAVGRRDWRWWTHERVCQAFRDHAVDGKPPLAEEWPHGTQNHPGYQTVKRLFGTWNDAVKAAGLTPRRGWRF